MPFGWGRKQKQELTDMTQRKDLDEAGVKVTADERLDLRIKFMADLEALKTSIEEKKGVLQPEEFLDDLRDLLYLLDNKLRQIAIAWGRAGTDRNFAIAMIAWEKLLPYGMDNITTTKTVLKAETLLTEALTIIKDQKHEQIIIRDKMDMVRKCEKSIRYSWLPYGLMIIDFSFKELDVTTLKNIVIHSVTPPMQGMVREIPVGYEKGMKPQIPQETD